MRVRFVFSLIAILFAVTEINAQDFAADSVFYTPIPNGAKKQVHGTNAFKDSLTNNKTFSYFFNLQVGPLIGCNDCSEGKEITFTSSTIHGITIGKKIRTGLGIGLDSYTEWHTMPIFGGVNWDVFGTKNTNAIFVQFNYGWSKPWRNKSRQESEYGFKDVDGGRMVSTQIGYRIKYHDLRVSLSVGTKYQRVSANYEYPTYYYTEEGGLIQGTPNTKVIRESMNRLQFALTVGWK
ncbi:MAG TPA: hypothetical protein PLJ60_06890 [Chryseolinea sp.]|nr:hypothetical protein [Chryseolinea sp.]HPM30045.1 hypothetical protein [Chryseolinea sp.]